MQLKTTMFIVVRLKAENIHWQEVVEEMEEKT